MLDEKKLMPVCQRFAEQMLVFVLSQRSVFLFALFFSIYCICVGNFDASTYYLPMRFLPPYHIDTLLGWYPFWALQFICSISYLCGTVVVTMYFVSCCYYLGALCNHFDYHLELVDAEFEKNSNPINARKTLINAIDHHNVIYECVKFEFSSII